MRRRFALAQLSLPRDEFPNLVESAEDTAEVWLTDPNHWWGNTVDLIMFGLERMLERSRDGSARLRDRLMATYALIPGGGGDPWEWHRLVPELEARGHDALAVRLPADDDTAGWSEYADAVIDAVGDHLDLIVVAESMGGFTAPIVCARRPVDLLVLLNAMIPVPGETFNAWWSNTDSGAARRAYHASIGLAPAEAEDDAVIYYHDLPAELGAAAQARTWQDQSATPLDEPWPLAAWPDTPDPGPGGPPRSDVPARFSATGRPRAAAHRGR